MPTFQAFHATIRVDGEDLSEYDVQVDDNEKQVSCWIPSEAGKNFSVCWSAAESPTDLCGDVKLDGIGVGGCIRRSGWKGELIKSYCYASNTTTRKFCFSTIIFTDDDVYLTTPVADLGEIKIEIWTVQICKENREATPNRIDVVASSNVKVHERSKKVGTHRIQFGDLEEVPRRTFSTVNRIVRLATFVFRYRPLGLLQANGIAPLPSPVAHPQQNNKRKSRDGDTKSTDEDDINRRVKELKDELKQLESQRVKELKDELEQLESRRAKKIKVKVEKREHSPRLNEVIDLT